tara:strand:- start:506 stop:637 length:132 start_codon:yes stop_codon:yes gene_type:complete
MKGLAELSLILVAIVLLAECNNKELDVGYGKFKYEIHTRKVLE